MTTKDLEVFILNNIYMFSFTLNSKNAIESLFPEGIHDYLDYGEDNLKKLILNRIVLYFEKQFENKKLPQLFKKYIEYNRKEVLTAGDFVLFDELLSKMDYELSFDDVSKITSNEKVKKFLDNKISKEILDTNDFLGQLYEFVNIGIEEKDQEIDINAISDDNVKLFKNDMRFYSMLTPEQEKMYTIKYKETRDPEAKEMLICCNQRLVWSEAARFMNRGLEFLDLISEGNIGFMKALDRFDPDLGYKLSTYITWWVRQAIRRAIHEKGKTIRYPVHLGERFSKLSRIENILRQELQRTPTDEEVLNLWNELSNSKKTMTLERIKELRNYKDNSDPISLNKIEGNDDDCELVDFIADEGAVDPVKYSEEIDIKLLLDKALDELSIFKTEEGNKRASQMVRMREGIFNEETIRILEKLGKNTIPREMTLWEIADIYGISGERVRQIVEKAKRGMKKYLLPYETGKKPLVKKKEKNNR